MARRRRPPQSSHAILASLLHSSDPVHDQFAPIFGLSRQKIGDRVVFSGNKWRIEKGFDTSPTPIDSKPDREKDGLSNVGGGYIHFVRSYWEDRRLFIAPGRKGGKSLKQVLTPYGGAETVQTGAQFERSAFAVGVMPPDSNMTAYNPQEGSEYWARLWMYLSPGYVFAPSDNTPKLLRCWQSSNSNAEVIIGVRQDHANYPGVGFISAMSQGFNGGVMSLNSSKFSNSLLYGGVPGNGDWSTSGTQTAYPVDRWFHVEIYMYCSADPAKAEIRVWLDDSLVLARLGNRSSATVGGGYGGTLQTLTPLAGGVVHASPRVELQSNWGSTGVVLSNTQYMLIDDVIATNDPEWVSANGKVDSYGNKMIGSAY